MAAAWAALELLKVSTKFLLSPLFWTSGIFLRTIGYATASSTSATDDRHSRSAAHHKLLETISKRQQLLHSPSVVFAQDASAYSNVCEANERESPSRDDSLSPIRNDKVLDELEAQEDTSSIESAGPESVEDHSPSASTLSSDPIESSQPVAESTIATPRLPITSSDQTLSETPTGRDRPLSFVLAQFSRRATACNSSFELLPEDGVFIVPGNLSQVGSPHDHSLDNEREEPTEAERNFVLDRLGDELEEVERVVEEAVLSQSSLLEVGPTIAEGQTYFDTMSHSFKSVKRNSSGEIDTISFLLAIDSLLVLFQQFASTAFQLVQTSIEEDLRRIRVRHDVTLGRGEGEGGSIEALVRSERSQRRKLATESVVWTVRGLKVTARALRLNFESGEEEEELSVSFTRAWNEEYCKYISWILRPLFKLVVKACPSRQEFYQKLGTPPERVRQDLDEWLVSLEDLVKQLETFLTEGKYGKGM